MTAHPRAAPSGGRRFAPLILAALIAASCQKTDRPDAGPPAAPAPTPNLPPPTATGPDPSLPEKGGNVVEAPRPAPPVTPPPAAIPPVTAKTVRAGDTVVTLPGAIWLESVPTGYQRYTLKAGTVLDVDKIENGWVVASGEWDRQVSTGLVEPKSVELAPQPVLRYSLTSKQLAFPEMTRPHRFGGRTATAPVARPGVLAALSWCTEQLDNKGNDYLRNYRRDFRAAVRPLAGGGKPDPAAADRLLGFRVVLQGGGTIEKVDPVLESYFLTRVARLKRAGGRDAPDDEQLRAAFPDPVAVIESGRFTPQFIAALDGLMELGRVPADSGSRLVDTQLKGLPDLRSWREEHIDWARVRVMRLRTDIENQYRSAGRRPIEVAAAREIDLLADQFARGLFRSDLLLLFTLVEIHVLLEEIAGGETLDVTIRPDSDALDKRGVRAAGSPAAQGAIGWADLVSARPIAQLQYDHTARSFAWQPGGLVGSPAGGARRP